MGLALPRFQGQRRPRGSCRGAAGSGSRLLMCFQKRSSLAIFWSALWHGLGVGLRSCCSQKEIQHDKMSFFGGGVTMLFPSCSCCFPWAYEERRGWHLPELSVWRKLLVLNIKSAHRHSSHKKYYELHPHIDRSSTCPGWFLLRQLFCKTWQILAPRSLTRWSLCNCSHWRLWSFLCLSSQVQPLGSDRCLEEQLELLGQKSWK